MKNSWTKNLLVSSLLTAWLAMPTSQAVAQAADEGESASFAALDTTDDHDGGSTEDLEPECMDCGDMLMEEAAQAAMLKAGGRRPAMAVMNDKLALKMKLRKPVYVKSGPSPRILNKHPRLFSVTSTATPVVGAVMVDLNVQINPAMRSRFPLASDPAACDPSKPFNRKQKGWYPLGLSSTYVTKTGLKGSTRPHMTYLCVRQPTVEKPACTLSCGEGSCQQRYDSAAGWTASCACRPGYKPNAAGTSCEDVNECAAPKSPCPSTLACNNVPGKYSCACPDSKVLTARGCVAPPPSCPDCSGIAGSVCRKTPTFASCACPSGTKLAGGKCVALRQCAQDSCGPGSRCSDASTNGAIPVGDIRCTLPPGTVPRLAYATPLTKADPGAATFYRKPVDIDECKLAGVREACGANRCVNVDSTTPYAKKGAPGAHCRVKAFPPAPAPNAAWDNAGNKWNLP